MKNKQEHPITIGDLHQVHLLSMTMAASIYKSLTNKIITAKELMLGLINKGYVQVRKNSEGRKQFIVDCRHVTNNNGRFKMTGTALKELILATR